MGARTGEQFLERLRKTPRQLWLGDERVGDVTEHPALGGAARTLAAVFDRQRRYADECLVAAPHTGEPINISHVFPRSAEDLKRRNRGLARISEATVGLMGRTPDYMNVKFASFASRPSFWAGADQRNARGAENLVLFQKRHPRGPRAHPHDHHPQSQAPTRTSSKGTLTRLGGRGARRPGARILATSPFATRRGVTRPPSRPGPRPPLALESRRHAGLSSWPGQRRRPGRAPFDRTVERFASRMVRSLDDVEMRETACLAGEVEIYNGTASGIRET